MGGLGSGIWYRWNTRDTVEDSYALSTTLLRAALNDVADGKADLRFIPLSWLRGGQRLASIGVWIKRRDDVVLAQFSYTSTKPGQEPTKYEYSVLMTSTTPNYGGRRWWFHCPLSVNGRSCYKRVGKLYLPPGGAYFGCRTCYNLTYQSCNESNSGVRNMANAMMRGGLPDELIDQMSMGGLLVCLKAERVLEKRRKNEIGDLIRRWRAGRPGRPTKEEARMRRRITGL